MDVIWCHNPHFILHNENVRGVLSTPLLSVVRGVWVCWNVGEFELHASLITVLFSLGNKYLLGMDPMWKSLIKHYEDNHCLVDENWPWPWITVTVYLRAFLFLNSFLVNNCQLQETFELTKLRWEEYSTVRDKSMKHSRLRV